MDKKEIETLILKSFREKELMKDIQLNEDFFDLGVSSLTVVELQIVVEKLLERTVETAKLMAAPTVSEWIEIYANASVNKTADA